MATAKQYTNALVTRFTEGQRRAIEALRRPGESRADVVRRALAKLVAEPAEKPQRGKK